MSGIQGIWGPGVQSALPRFRPLSSASDAPKVTQTMRGQAVLDVPRFPTATFRIAALRPLEGQPVGTPGRYQIEGRFTLHGTEKPLHLQAQLAGAPPPGPLKLTGSFTIKQSDYGIKPYSTFAGLVKGADELAITDDLLLSPPAK